MDDIVKQAMAKWPNVPHCYGWLALDARGAWRMRDERAQALRLSGDKITNPALLAFINRNYARDETGAWYFQNGPQRVYVDLDAAPHIARTDPLHGFMLHTQEPLESVDAVWLSDAGQLLLQHARVLAQVDDRDAAQCLGAIRVDGRPVEGEQLLNWISNPRMNAEAFFMHRGRAIALRLIAHADIPQHFGFVPRPRAEKTNG